MKLKLTKSVDTRNEENFVYCGEIEDLRIEIKQTLNRFGSWWTTVEVGNFIMKFHNSKIGQSIYSMHARGTTGMKSISLLLIKDNYNWKEISQELKDIISEVYQVARKNIPNKYLRKINQLTN